MASLSVIVAILGNIISILVFLSPVTTLGRVVKKKSIENFKGYSYVCTLLSTSLWTFYGIIKPGGFLVATVNGAGSFLQATYLTLYIIYAPKEIRIRYLKLAAVLNVGCTGLVVAVILAIPVNLRVTILGFICAGLTLGMYGSPLSEMRTVIKTKSVEYMPFFLSFFLFVNAIVWSTYSALVMDYFIGVPNVIGLMLGAAQLILYAIYNNNSVSTKPIEKMEEEGSVHLVEMGDIDENKTDGSFTKKRSFPKKISMPKQLSLPKILRTQSLNSYIHADTTWPIGDEETGKKDIDHHRG